MPPLAKPIPFGVDNLLSRDPTPTLFLLPRQAPTTTVVPALYGALENQLDPGAIVGITLGAVAGFIILLWMIYACLNFGAAPEYAESSVTGSVVVERKSRQTHRHHKHRRRGSATIEVRRTTRVPAAVIVEETSTVGGSERIIIDEARRRSMSRGAPRVVPMSSAESDEDEVVVIEERSPPPNRRRSRVRSRERRSYGR